MNALKRYGQILTLHSEAYESLKNTPASFWFGLRLFIVVILIASLGHLSALANVNQQSPLAASLQQIDSSLQDIASRLPGFLAAPFQQASQMVESFSVRLQSLAPPLGEPLSQIIRIVGEWLASPLTPLASWLAASLVLFVFAIWAGGKGALRAHLSLLLLASAPLVLTVLGGFELSGTLALLARLLGFIALIWALVIAVKALSVAHGFSSGRAVGVMVLSFLVVAVLIPFVITLLLGVLLAIIL